MRGVMAWAAGLLCLLLVTQAAGQGLVLEGVVPPNAAEMGARLKEAKATLNRFAGRPVQTLTPAEQGQLLEALLQLLDLADAAGAVKRAK